MNLNSLLILLHVVSVVIWVGGMFFAHQCLRPVVASQLEPPQRLTLWVGVFKRFFPMVWITIILIPITGYALLFSVWGNMANTPLYVHLMNGIGIIMILIFLHVFFAPFNKLKNAVEKQEWPKGAAALNQIRMLVGLNTVLGMLAIIIATAGRFYY